jgi:lipopolysaccharide assembly outer membrane protein LptD (OstA)
LYSFQDSTNLSIPDSNKVANLDSTSLAQQDSTIKTKVKSKSGLDTLVKFKALDSIKIDLKSKKMRLVNDADLDMGQRNLKAKYIEIDFEKSTLEAYAGIDSAGFGEGYPIMNDKGEEFAGERIKFNLKTNKGIIRQGETDLDEGYYYGSKIKRVNQDDFFIEEGYYTPCENLEPSAYFGSQKMKLEGNDKIYMDPIIFYIQDLPFLVYPFGLFFSTKSGRRSGLLVPNFDFSDTRGVVLEGFGFYWAASQYWDTQITGNYYSKGGYLFSNRSQWKVGNELNGNLLLEYGNIRTRVGAPMIESYNFDLRNSWKINPYQNFDANIRIPSPNFNQNTQANLNRRVVQNIFSSANYRVNFQNWGNLTMGYTRNQNIITNSYSQSPKINYSIPNKRLFKMLGNDFLLSGSAGLDYTHKKDLSIQNIQFNQDSSFVDSSFVFSEKGFLSLRPNISYQLPKLWFFNITPSVGGGMNIYNRKVDKTYFAENDSVSEELSYGVFSEYWYNYNVSMQTTIYGIANPNIGKFKSIRHTLQPNITYRFRPDQSGDNFGFYQSYTDTAGREITYSVFERDGGGGASRRLDQSLNYNLNNKFEIKLDQGDTLEAKTLELMNLTLGGNYNFTLDSLKFSDISFNIRTPALKFINFSGSGNFSLYDQDAILDEDGEIDRYETVNRLLVSNGEGFGRLTSIRFSINTSFSSEGISLNVDPSVDNTFQEDTLNQNQNVGLGSRFTQRRNFRPEEKDIFGDSSPGWSPVSIPWDVSLGLNYSLSRSSPIQESERITANVSINIEPAPGWIVNGGFNYDIVAKELTVPQLTVRKDLGCWGLNFTWVPTGIHRHFRFSIGLNSAQLKDLMYEKTTSNYY